MSKSLLFQQKNNVIWRDDIDALVFEPNDHRGFCMVHRLAFRTLLRFCPEPSDCEAFFHAHEGAFRAAAEAKMIRENVANGFNFHLTSRDVTRQMDK